ncbi:MAG TPA: competence/damage-inducible protein A [Solirubrobacteraceae bacterium]|nr:competence/damage-inducible protein A [Solirubrobacteraceae bacterium]
MSAPSGSGAAEPGRSAAARAGILVTGTEVLSGRVSDRNGPWLARRLHELGVELAHTTIVGDRVADLRAALAFLADQEVDLILTSGGLGPTADDLTAAVVGGFQGREMVLDEALEGRIAEILRGLAARFPHLDVEAVRAGNRKQATIPRGATVLEPVGTAPGLVVPPAGAPGAAGRARSGPTIVVLPGPPRELQPMWPAALQTDALQAALSGAREYRVGTLRLFGMPESEIAQTLRIAEADGVELARMEITTCLKRGEVEVVTRYEPDAQELYDAFVAVVRRRHAGTLFSWDGSTVDQQVAGLLRGDRGGRRSRTLATAESCTGGLLAARLTELPGASDYFLGGLVVYADAAKLALARVPAQLIERHGAVSAEVARALADGARAALGADLGVGVTGIAGPGGGSETKPVGLVWLSVTLAGGEPLTRSVTLPGERADVRDRATTVAMHLVRRALGEPAAS